MQDKLLVIVDVFLCFAVAFFARRDAVRGREIAVLRQAIGALARREIPPPSSSRIIDRPTDVRIVEATPLRRSARKSDADGDATIIVAR